MATSKITDGSRLVDPLHRQVEQVVDHQRLGLAAFEPPGVDHAGDHHLDGVDAAHPGHRDEDPVPGEQLHHQSLDPRGAPVGPPLDDDVADLAHLVPGVVEDRQVPDPGDEDRGRRCRHGGIIPRAWGSGGPSTKAQRQDAILGAHDHLPGPLPGRRRRAGGGGLLGSGARVCDPTRGRPPGRLVDGVDEHTLVAQPWCPSRRRSSSGCTSTCTWPPWRTWSPWARRCSTQTQPWTVLADPEGGELCAFVRRPGELPDYRLYEVVVDCGRPGP